MRICQIAESPFGKLDGKIFSPIASVRLRALQIAPEIVALGHGVTVTPTDMVDERIRDGSFFDADVYVFQKMLHDVTPLLQRLKSEGKAVIVDVCDDIRANAHLRDFYPSLIRKADLVTTSSQVLADRLKADLSTNTVYIPDCVELTRGWPSAPGSRSENSRINLLWFGRRINAGPLFAQLSNLAKLAADYPLELSLVSDFREPRQKAIAEAAAPLPVTTLNWSPAALEGALAKADVVLIPLTGSVTEEAKSSNRLQEALWAGRCVVASRSPSHRPFADCVYLCDDLADGIRTALERPEDSLDRIRAGQFRIEEQFTPRTLATAWLSCFNEAKRIAELSF